MTDPDHVLEKLQGAVINQVTAAKSERRLTLAFVCIAIVSGVLLAVFLAAIITAYKANAPMKSFTFEDAFGNVQQCVQEETTKVFVCEMVFKENRQLPPPSQSQTTTA